MGRRASGVRHHGTHRALTGQAGPGSGTLAPLSLDAIIVPGSRPAPGLDHAVTLARAAGCWLLILCSQRLQGLEVKGFLAERSFRKAIVIELPPGYSHELLQFPELGSVRKELPLECDLYATDLSMKRNVGLVLAKLLGWQRVVFLDDDIRDIAYPDLQATVDMLGSFPAVGMWVTDFPDNSIVCHANRQTAGSQDVFVSGAVLAVDCGADIGFFPDIYNEDWLFFFDDASNGRLANSRLKATQLTYYPFANPKRAAWQEFGDVLAEGLYALLHLGWNVEDATPEYWNDFLKARQSFLEAILTRSQNADAEIREEMVASVESALACLGDIKPDLCVRYIQSWRADLRDWKRRMAEIPVASSLEDALETMRLVPTASASSTWRVLPYWDEAPPPHPVTAGPVAIPQTDTMKQMPQHHLRRSAATAALATTKPLEAVSDEDVAKAATRETSYGESPSSVDQANRRRRRSRLRLYPWPVMILATARISRRPSGEASPALGSTPVRDPSLGGPERVASGRSA
jgi:hypothetical protein